MGALARYLGPVVALVYGVISASMSLINKTALSNFDFPVVSLLFLQMLCTVLILGACPRPLNLSARTARAVCPVAVLYALNTLLALSSLSHVHVAIYTAIKRLTPLA
eukprot:g31273.t1